MPFAAFSMGWTYSFFHVCKVYMFISCKGIKEGWYDGGSIAFAVFLVIIVTGMTLLLYLVIYLARICIHQALCRDLLMLS